MLADPYEALEFDRIVALLRRYTPSPLGAARLDELQATPRLESAQAATAELAIVGEATAWFREAGQDSERSLPPPRFSGIEDVRESVQRLSMEGVVLDASEIRAILDLLSASQRIRQALLADETRRPLLHAWAKDIPDFRLLLSALAGKILPNDELSNLASTALSRVRRQIEKQRALVETSLERFVRRHADSGVLQDKYVTMRNGRTVVPVKSTLKSRVDGIVHGASSSGQTVFVEPLDTIVQNNRLVRLREDEQTEILRILREMSAKLHVQRFEVRAAVTAVGELEYVFARAQFSIDFSCCVPRFGVGAAARIVLDEARHPLLQDLLHQQARVPVPLSARLEGGERSMVVSGPNAGGKTVVLKTIGVLAAMAQAGIPVPAADAEFPWFERILADIGDSQSISESLSTFSAHVSKLNAILEGSSPETLAVLDELGTATDPEDGGALAVAVVERLREAGGFTVVSTHLPELKMYGARTEGVVSASMGLDQGNLSVTYRLHTGIPGQSAGLDMAERFGMPPDVIRRARALKGHAGEHASAFLADLQERARKYAELSRSLRRQARDLEARKLEIEQESARRARDLRKQTEDRVGKLVATLERTYRESLDAALKKISATATRPGRAASKQSTRAIGSFRRAAAGEVQSALGTGSIPGFDEGDDFELGDRVRLVSMGISGEVVRKLDGGRWEVRAGAMRLQAGSDDIAVEEEALDRPTRLPVGVSLDTAEDVGELPFEINVIGKTADEALSEVDKFLDRAVLANRTKLRVVHGFGKDVLRRELWQMFAHHVHVAKYYQARQQEGGAGATIVEIGDA